MDRNYKYMVATRCFTYNQAPYIEETLRGFALQETSFPVVFIIVDDASIDGEPNVLRSWVSENLQYESEKEIWQEMPYGHLSVAPLKEKPQLLFVTLLLAQNHYAIEKRKKKSEFIKEWECDAKYIAMCEGDDYWIDPKKLQKQVDLLEEHNDYSLCFTDKLILKGEKKYHDVETNRLLQTVSDFRPIVIDGGYIHLATLLFRKKMYDKIPKAFDDNPWLMTDFQMCIELMHEGGVSYLPEITAVYRKLDSSACHFINIEKAIAFQESAYNARSYYCHLYKDMNELQSWVDNYYCNMGLTIACRFHDWMYIKKYISFAKEKGNLSISFLVKNAYVYIIEYPFVVKIRKFLTNKIFKKRHGLQEV